MYPDDSGPLETLSPPRSRKAMYFLAGFPRINETVPAACRPVRLHTSSPLSIVMPLDTRFDDEEDDDRDRPRRAHYVYFIR